MSRERENLIHSHRKARREGCEKLQKGEITFDEYAFVMAGFEIAYTEMMRAGFDATFGRSKK